MVARHAVAQGLYDGDGTGRTGLVAQSHVLFSSEGKDLPAVFGKQSLVGRNHGLAVADGFEDEFAGHAGTAHKLHDYLDLGITRDGYGVAGEGGAFGQVALFAQVVDSHGLDDDLAAGTAQDVFTVLLEHLYKAAAYSAEPGNADADFLTHKFSAVNGFWRFCDGPQWGCRLEDIPHL